MRIIKKINQLTKEIKKLKSQGKKIGFVPTMGALHEGHASLLKYARKDNDIVVLSIFVNPTQFGPKEDFKNYPRTFKQDIDIARRNNVDIIFYPSADEIYAEDCLTRVEVGGISNILCGRSRPEHFKGVATIVLKLLNIVSADQLYLGQKDAQQVVVLKRMIQDLNVPVKLKICPTVREADGLAMSSRNQYLSSQERQQAPILYSILKMAKQEILSGQRTVGEIVLWMKSQIVKHSAGRIDYVACVDAQTLKPKTTLQGAVMIALAVKFGKTRLIDNIIFNIK